ncbi:PP2C family serine/threonine-protein phosphatase [Bacillus sp. ISL-7]|uniref:PP2C family serine/threonine-protein phosphatase n=1 Tax=Bacillus sp. ISL-7 TaxID=2819136 RepID=UPI001BE9AC35|nr:PP2C family serine/threonine-protein phosphatase [Bacillus sp. ISL-7]MBT2736224.1 protein phosphatase 2C domain-containing protein [Bacillus sp. ISL-7]
MTQIRDWKYTFASVIGTSHQKVNTPCQDSSKCQVIDDPNGEKILVAVVSDGAGSAKFSDQGSSLACSLFVEEVSQYLREGKKVKDLDKRFIENWIEYFQCKISTRAKEQEVSIREFACTIVAAIVGNDYAAFFQVGDGAIVCLETDHTEENYNWEFWPDKGEFENTTYFITDPMVKKNINFDVLPRSVDEVSLFTDGIQHLTLHYQSQTVHNPFFKPMFNVLRKVDKDNLDNLNSSLEKFLNSERVNEKTDDDKTLLLASRRGVENLGNE